LALLGLRTGCEFYFKLFEHRDAQVEREDLAAERQERQNRATGAAAKIGDDCFV
jgi:hypothetical protein